MQILGFKLNCDYTREVVQTNKTRTSYMKNAINIRKEEICKLKFFATILTEKRKRQVNLNLSSSIDNSNKLQKTAIYMSTTRGVFQVIAKIMMKGDKFVVLKGNIIIPINSIIKVGA